MIESLRGAPIWRPETSENIWNLLWLSLRLFSLFWACNHSHRRFSCDAGFQTSKKHAESMFSCTWHACEKTFLCHALWKNLKFKLLYFQNKARYRAEICKHVLRDEAKKWKNLFTFAWWILVFYDVTLKSRIGAGIFSCLGQFYRRLTVTNLG